ncbi:MAG: phenylacetate--CoA ligase [Bacteroidales bacterium]|nr:phenylacetate--CoA ligase [Bacteroidales bacterium]MDD4712753.1 phenylacetate--CoA ligase [Bacteroidales bacterium]
MIWNESYECMGREEMREVQNKRLRTTVEHVYHNSPFYRAKMQELGITPMDIETIDDLVKLPFTIKTDLRDQYPFGLFSVPMSEIVRLHASSGTTGKPIVAGYTRKDLSTWSEVLARTFTSGGCSRNDIFQIAYGYGLFTGGLGAHYGAENIGASVIPISAGNTEKQIQLMTDFGSTVLCCTPSYALYLGEAVEDKGVKDKLKLRVGFFGAEPWTEAMRVEIEKKLNIKAFDIFGLTEVIGPGVSYECYAQNGMHINEDHFLPEIINPVTLEPVAPGEVGELVLTTITKEGMPVIRYRTKDLTRLMYEPCSCGRTSVRMHKIMGRSDDMLIIRGVNVFPTQIESVLMEFGETAPHYHLYVDRENNTDTFDVHVEVRPENFTDDMSSMLDLRKRIEARIQSVVGIHAHVKLVEPRSIERSTGKAQRVTDKRNLYKE